MRKLLVFLIIFSGCADDGQLSKLGAILCTIVGRLSVVEAKLAIKVAEQDNIVCHDAYAPPPGTHGMQTTAIPENTPGDK